MVFLWLGAAEPEAFNIDLSFQLLFMIIIGGLGSIVGAFFGAAIIHLMPIALRALPALLGLYDRRGDNRPVDLHDYWRSDHPIPDRRAARIGAALANHEAEAARLAIPLLRWRAAT